MRYNESNNQKCKVDDSDRSSIDGSTCNGDTWLSFTENTKKISLSLSVYV